MGLTSHLAFGEAIYDSAKPFGVRRRCRRFGTRFGRVWFTDLRKNPQSTVPMRCHRYSSEAARFRHNARAMEAWNSVPVQSCTFSTALQKGNYNPKRTWVAGFRRSHFEYGEMLWSGKAIGSAAALRRRFRIRAVPRLVIKFRPRRLVDGSNALRSISCLNLDDKYRFELSWNGR